MVLVRCFDYLVVLGTNDAMIYSIDAKFLGQTRAAEAVYEAEAVDGQRYIVLFNEDSDSIVLQERDGVLYDYYARLVRFDGHLLVKGAPALKLRYTTYSERTGA